MASFSDRLKFLRKEKKLSQAELATAISIERGALAAYEQGRSQAPDEIKKSLAQFFGVTIDYLCGFSDLKVPKDFTDYDHILYSNIPFIDKVYKDSKSVRTYLLIPNLLIKENAGEYFLLNSPDSFVLNNIKIMQNDTLLIQEIRTPEKGNLLLIKINDTLYLKKVFVHKDTFFLFNSNDTNLISLNDNNIYILGKVIHSFISME
ncbi:helix-turn-helix domain-containing protein [Clostridium sp. 19966]|uniref:helix-turn-helix domain-containing protein n=1 Tax=Clostridium sp. 19966 TaxID=2768166 RepID=UPI0028DE860D|nr:helix-turn-helix domain-containing protein [Clostridium sp. 19966]MDT8718209.1 helix-turn-helix domain-containing protein [Clostridium sp. 19966]